MNDPPPPAGDARIAALAEAAERLAHGQREGLADLHVTPDDDPVGRIGSALAALARSLDGEYAELSRLDALTARVNQGLLFEDVLNGIYESFRDIIPYNRIGCALLGDGGRVLTAQWARTDQPVVRLGKGYSAPMAGSSLQRILETGEPRILSDLLGYLEGKPHSAATRLIVEEGLRASLTCPLVANGVPIGFLFFASVTPGAYDGAHVRVFQRIAGQLSVLVEKGRIVSDLAESKRQLEARNRFIRDVFGRYLTDEVVTSLLETPSGLRLGGEKRTVTILISDLRGFTSLSERLDPEAVVALLNGYLAEMTDVIVAHGGTIDEFLGDAILVVFGAPLRSEDHAERAVACGLEMLARMDVVNARNRAAGLPEVEMGIGIHTGEVVVGSIGSERRAKYGVVGSAVNLASRIESYTFGGQLLVSAATRAAVTVPLLFAGEMTVEPKGVPHPVTLHDVVGIEGARPRRLAGRETVTDEIEVSLPVGFQIVEGKDTGGNPIRGRLVSLSRDGAVLLAERSLRPLTNLKIVILGSEDRPAIDGLYAKTLPASPSGAERRTTIRFTSVPPEAAALFEALRGRA